MLIIYKCEENEEDKTLEILKSIFNSNSTISREVEKIESKNIIPSKETVLYEDKEITLCGVDDEVGTITLITGIKAEIKDSNDQTYLELSYQSKDNEQELLQKRYANASILNSSQYEPTENIDEDHIIIKDDCMSVRNNNYKIINASVMEIEDSDEIGVIVHFKWIGKEE